MSDMARMLDDTVERLLSRYFAAHAREDADATGADLMRLAVEAGLDLVLAPEDAGGIGGGVLEAAAITTRWGYHGAAGPILETLLLKRLSGFVNSEGAGLVLDGDSGLVAPCPAGTHRVIVARKGQDGRTELAEVAADQGTPQKAMSGETVVLLAQVQGTPIATDLPHEDFAATAALLTASAILGASQRLLEITIEHANTRKQFGKPLGKFQAIQHQLADAVSEHVVAQAAVMAAIRAQDAGTATSLGWRAAKVQAARAGSTVAAAAHQVHGAIGYTDEHVMQHFTKRIWIWRDQFGREAALEREIGQEAAAQAGRLWSWMID